MRWHGNYYVNEDGRVVGSVAAVDDGLFIAQIESLMYPMGRFVSAFDAQAAVEEYFNDDED